MMKHRHKLFKKLFGIVFIVVLIMGLTACGQAKESKTAGKTDIKNLRIGYLNVMDDAQALVANDAKLYEKHGLNVELKLFSSGTDMIKAIVGGQLDAGVLGFTNALAWAAEGADVKVIGGAQIGYHSMITRKDSGIKSIDDLKGKTVASQKQGSTADIVLNGVTFKNAGLTRSDVNMQYVSPSVSIQSLAAGKVDAAFVFEPYDTIARMTLGAESIYEIGKVWPFPCMVVISSGEILKKDRGAIDRMLDAQKEAIEMLQKQPDKAAEAITHRFIPDPAIKDVNGNEVKSVKVMEEAIRHQTFNWEITEDQVKRMQEIADMMLNQGILKQKVNVPDILDLSWQDNQKK